MSTYAYPRPFLLNLACHILQSRVMHQSQKNNLKKNGNDSKFAPLCAFTVGVLNAEQNGHGRLGKQSDADVNKCNHKINNWLLKNQHSTRNYNLK